MEFVIAVLLILLTILLLWFISHQKKPQQSEQQDQSSLIQQLETLEKQLSDTQLALREKETIEKEIRQQIQQKDSRIIELQKNLDSERQTKVTVQTKFDEAQKNITEQKKLLDEANQKLSDTFKALSSDALRNNNQTFLDLAKKTLETLISEAKGDFGKSKEAIERIVAPVKESLEKYETQIREMEKARESAYGGLREQIEQLTKTHLQLQKETTNLVSALRSPKVKGKWGEITLRRVIEVAGMSEHCDFQEQVSVDTEEGRKRPDLIVYLPGNRNIVVDAKVPLKSYMEAIETENEGTRNDSFKKHARAVREYMQGLCSKTYWNQFSPTPDFVVLFLPGESFFSAALEQDRSLIEDAIESRVIIATPTTLIALLRTVAYSWYQQKVAENAHRIADMGKDLFDRICKFAEHLDGVGGGLQQAVKSYNSAIGSWQSRLVPSARKFKELGAATPEKKLPKVEPIDTTLKK